MKGRKNVKVYGRGRGTRAAAAQAEEQAEEQPEEAPVVEAEADNDIGSQSAGPEPAPGPVALSTSPANHAGSLSEPPPDEHSYGKRAKRKSPDSGPANTQSQSRLRHEVAKSSSTPEKDDSVPPPGQVAVPSSRAPASRPRFKTPYPPKFDFTSSSAALSPYGQRTPFPFPARAPESAAPRSTFYPGSNVYGETPAPPQLAWSPSMETPAPGDAAVGMSELRRKLAIATPAGLPSDMSPFHAAEGSILG